MSKEKQYFKKGVNYKANTTQDIQAEYIGNGLCVITVHEPKPINIGREELMTDKEFWIEHPKPAIPNTGSRTFDTGASRNSDEGKLDFEGFLSPTVLKVYAEYMHKNRHLEDGTLRDSDNWQKGIPVQAYMKSMYRHFFDTWSKYRGLKTPETQVENLCGMLFNTMGMLHELLKEEVELENKVESN